MALATSNHSAPESYSDDELDQMFCSFLAENPGAWLISDVIAILGIAFTLQVSKRWVALMEEGRVDRVAPALYQHPTLAR